MYFILIIITIIIVIIKAEYAVKKTAYEAAGALVSAAQAVHDVVLDFATEVVSAVGK